MKLHTRLTVVFSLLALIPLLTVSYLGYINQREALLKKTIEQLISLAEVQENRVNEKLDRYLEEAKLITSRTQLRLSIAAFTQARSSVERERITRIIKDARDSVGNVNHVTVFDLDGEVIASTRSERIGGNYSDEDYFEVGKRAHTLHELFIDENNILRARIVGPFTVDGRLIAVVELIASAAPIVAVTEDHTGLGETGEVVLARKNNSGDALFLTPLRFDASGALNRAVPKEKVNVPITFAVAGEERIFLEKHIVDYRKVPVIAVTRFVDSLGWGLVVKIDRKEALAPVVTLAKSYLSITTLSVFIVILMSYLVTRAITKPIHRLTLFAQNLQSGNFSMRTEVQSTDEIGFLARTLNTMADRLQELYRGLEQKVHERTAELEEAQAKDEAILASIGEGLVFTDVDKRIVFINRAAETMLGHKAQEMVGQQWTDVAKVVDEKGKKISKPRLPIHRVLRSRTSTTTSVTDGYFYTRRDGSIFPVNITASSVTIDDTLVGAIVVFRDVTKEKEIDKAKSEFVSLASHQLRTPLSTINWYAEMLLAGDAGKLSEDQKKYLEEIYVGNQRMVVLVNALLNVSRIELGTFAVEPEPTDITALVNDVVDEQRPQVAERKLKLTTELDEVIPTMNVDRKLLWMVFQNLLSNAIKYTPEGGSVTLSMFTKKAGETCGGKRVTKQSLCVSVADTGFGIPKDQQQNIFTKLYRADNVKEKDTEGTGLGLYIVRSIVEHSGGKIWFESEEDKGTIFYVTLPMEGMKKKTGDKKLG